MNTKNEFSLGRCKKCEERLVVIPDKHSLNSAEFMFCDNPKCDRHLLLVAGVMLKTEDMV